MNNPCQHLDDYLDGELAPNPLADFENHLEECSDCQNEIEIFSKLNCDLLSAWQTISAPNLLAQNIKFQFMAADAEDDKRIDDRIICDRSIVHRSERRIHWRDHLGWITVAASLALLLYGSSFWIPSGKQTVRLPQQQFDLKSSKPIEEAINEPVVKFLNKSEVGQDTLVVRSPISNKRFTIVKAYPVFRSATTHLNSKGTVDDTAN